MMLSLTSPDGRHTRNIVLTKMFSKKNVNHNKRPVSIESMFMKNFGEKLLKT